MQNIYFAFENLTANQRRFKKNIDISFGVFYF